MADTPPTSHTSRLALVLQILGSFLLVCPLFLYYAVHGNAVSAAWTSKLSYPFTYLGSDPCLSIVCALLGSAGALSLLAGQVTRIHEERTVHQKA